MEYDAVVVGSGPNGLAAAIQLARSKCSVCLFEANESIGGGMRSAELTLPGFIHDVCSAIHPLAVASPFFRSLDLAAFGLEWVHPGAPMAHPFIDGHTVLTERSVDETARSLGPDAEAYRTIFNDLVQNWEALISEVLAPVHIPRHPLLVARFGWQAVRSAQKFIDRHFHTKPARAMFAGMSAHSLLGPSERPGAAFGLILTMLAHAVGWPMARGGSQKIADALGRYFVSLGGRIVTGSRVRSLDELPKSRVVLCDVSPRELLTMAGTRLPDTYRKRLERYRYGPGVFKIDWALSSPIPWKDARCLRAATIHLGGSQESIGSSGREVARGEHPQKPFVILTQPSLFDSTRAPSGKHTAWAYCHVPNGSNTDMTSAIESQVEAAAPGFRSCVLARNTLTARELGAYNPNYVGGNISGGLVNLRQLLARPVLSVSPYRTPVKGLYICSASTPPTSGVHGMCGYFAARSALATLAS